MFPIFSLLYKIDYLYTNIKNCLFFKQEKNLNVRKLFAFCDEYKIPPCFIRERENESVCK